MKRMPFARLLYSSHGSQKFHYIKKIPVNLCGIGDLLFHFSQIHSIMEMISVPINPLVAVSYEFFHCFIALISSHTHSDML